MGRTACTEAQCLYKGALYLYLKFLNGFTSSNNNYQTTDYFGLSAFYQWNNPTLNVTVLPLFKDYGCFVGANEGSSPLLLCYKYHYFTSNFLKFSHNKFPRTRLP